MPPTLTNMPPNSDKYAANSDKYAANSDKNIDLSDIDVVSFIKIYWKENFDVKSCQIKCPGRSKIQADPRRTAVDLIYSVADW